MTSLLRRGLVLVGCSLLVGSGCMFGRPIVDDESRYYPSDGVISCTGTRCSDLPAFELELPSISEDSPCAQDLPTLDLIESAAAGGPLEGNRYVLASESRLEVDFGTIQVRDACLVLAGPVQVRLGSASELTHVTVMLGPAPPSERDGGEPSVPPELVPPDAAPDATSPKIVSGTGSRATPNLYIGYAKLDGVLLQPLVPEQPSGTAQIEFSTCAGCETQVDALTVTQSQVATSRLRATTLNLVGGTFDTVELSFERGLLAGFVANDLRTLECDTLSLVGATLAGRATKIGPCNCGQPDPTQDSDGGSSDAEVPDGGSSDADVPDADAVDAGFPDGGPVTKGPSSSCLGATISQSTVLEGMVDGHVHAENSSFQSVLFARHAATSVDLWNGSIKLAVVCEQPMELRLDGSATVGCTSCDAPDTTSACRLGEAPRLLANKCKRLGTKLPSCEPPLPMQMIPTPPASLGDL